MIKNILSFFSFIILFASCSNEIVIDNSLNQDIHVLVKEKKYNVKANSFEKINISSGTYFVVSINSNGDTLLSENIDFSEAGILNATLSKYAIWKDVFCKEVDYEEYKQKLDLKDTVKIDGLAFLDIDLEVVNDAFIGKKWDVGLDKKMPEEIEIPDSEKFKILTKIYRIEALKEAFNYYGGYDFKDLTEQEINEILKNRKENN